MIRARGEWNMNTVLYEAPTGYGNIVLSMAIPAVMLLFLIMIPPINHWKETSAGAMRPAGRRYPVLYLALGGIFVAVCAYIVLKSQLEMYRRVIVPYENGQYEIVEGYVQNFVPMPREGHSNEMFDINGVHFEYSDYNVVPGYNNARVKGGVIRGNGQYLRVGYVYLNATYGNIIVYIEELSPP